MIEDPVNQNCASGALLIIPIVCVCVCCPITRTPLVRYVLGVTIKQFS